jgi:hypothetical protein
MDIPYSVISVPSNGSFEELISAVRSGTDHLIVYMEQWKVDKELLKRLKYEVVNHKSEDKSLIFVLKEVDDALLNKATFSITPTIGEAEDMLTMEEIERLI